MKINIKFFLTLSILLLGLSQISFAEWEKVIIDQDTKKIIILSGDKQYDIDNIATINAEDTTTDEETNNESSEEENKDKETVNNDTNAEEENETSEEDTSIEEDNPLYKNLEEGTEIEKAIYWMYQNWLTKYDNETDYRPDDPLLREEAAKIVGQAYNILWFPQEVKNNECSFSDEETFDPTLKDYIHSTCTYWIFKWNNGKFSAQRSLTKAEALTVLIRILEWKLSSEDFNPRWTLYFTKAKGISLTKETDVLALDRAITRREIALLIYRFKEIVLSENLTEAAKTQLSLIDTNPGNFVPQENKASEEKTTETEKKDTETTNKENNYEDVLSWAEFWSTSTLSVLNNPEIVEAIQWMNENGLTNSQDISSYAPFDNLTREQAAKMFAKFAKSLNYTSTWDEDCNFKDISNADSTLKDSIVEVCTLWIMKGSNWKFSPKEYLTKAQFVAMLIRLSEWERLDENVTPRWANYFLKAWELGILNAEDITSFEGLITRYEAALLFYRFQLKQQITTWLNVVKLKNELISSVKNSDDEFVEWDVDDSYAISLDSNLLKNQFFQEWYMEILWTRYSIKKTTMTIFDIWEESFVWYWDIIDIAKNSKIGTVNFVVSNWNVIQWTLRISDPAKKRIIKESKNTNARYNLIEQTN